MCVYRVDCCLINILYSHSYGIVKIFLYNKVI